MNFLKDFLTALWIIFCTILVLGSMLLLFKAIFVKLSVFILVICVVLMGALGYSCFRFIVRNS